MVRRRESDDYIGPSKGLMKWANKFFRFVLFPFIHPLFFVILLAVLGGSIVGIHYFVGVSYKDIPMWIVGQAENVYENVLNKDGVNVDIDSVNINQGVFGAGYQNVTHKKTSDKVVRAIERKAFKSSLLTSAEDPIKANNDGDQIKANNEVKREEAIVNSGELFEYHKYPELGYVYSKNPRVMTGEIEVIDVNKIKINREEVFLYGIYSDPLSDAGVKGASYLQKMVKGKMAECRVVAFTQYADLTVICVVDGVNINRKLFNMGFTQNVGIK